MIADPNAPAFEYLRVEVADGIGRLTLTRPKQLNALSPALLRELIAASRWLAALPDLRVLLLCGQGRAFSAGFDLDAMRASQHDLDHDTADLGRQMVEAFESIPAITLAAVRGHCVGGGLLLAGICDLRIAAEDARFSIPEMAIGIPLAWGGVPRLIRLVGPAVAMELVLDCNSFGAAQALAWRFVNRLAPTTELDAQATAWAQRLAQRPLQALRSTKRRFAAAAQSLCSGAGSEVDAEALLAAFADPETQAMQRSYIAARRG